MSEVEGFLLASIRAAVAPQAPPAVWASVSSRTWVCAAWYTLTGNSRRLDTRKTVLDVLFDLWL
jgi:hypothetical protein